MWSALQNSSICLKMGAPYVCSLFWPKGTVETLLLLVIAWKLPLLLTFARGFMKRGQFSGIRPFAPKRSHRVFLTCLAQMEEWRPLSFSETHGNFNSYSPLREDSRNVASSSRSIHLRQNGAAVCFSCPFWPKGRLGTLLFIGIGWKLPLLLIFA